MNVQNYVAGRRCGGYGGTFKVRSPFSGCTVELPASTLLDIGDALAAARAAMPACMSMSVEEKGRILRSAAKRLSFSGEELSHLVEMQGMPVTQVRARVAYAGTLLSSMVEGGVMRHGVVDGRLGHCFQDGTEYRLAPQGIVSALIPPNDPAEAAYVMAHVVAAGAAIVLKPSQREPFAALKTAEVITDAGYTAGGINVVHWDSGAPANGELLDALLKRTDYRIFMGDKVRADELLPREGNNCVFSAGSSKAIVAEGVDIETVAGLLTQGALGWANNCVTTRTAVVVGEEQADDLSAKLKGLFEAKVVGSPFEERTEIGYIDPGVIDKIANVMTTMREFQGAKVVLPLTRVSSNQMGPVLVRLSDNDPESPFATKELPYCLAVVAVPSFQDAVSFIDRSAREVGGGAFMAVSIYAPFNSYAEFSRQRPVYAGLVDRMRTHMVFYNRPSLQLSPYLGHQGIDLTTFLTRSRPVVEAV